MSVIKIARQDIAELGRIIVELRNNGMSFTCEMVCGIWEIHIK